jgi:L-ascorbate metabolism protein UlaG (beta-lactamase superfamily)
MKVRLRVLSSCLVGVSLWAGCSKMEDAPNVPNPTVVVPPAPHPSAANAAPVTRTTDTITTAKGDLRVTPLHHATVLFEFGGKAFYVDPAKGAIFDGLPKADVVFITDIHGDHMDPAAVDQIKQASTVIVAPPAVMDKLPGAGARVTLKNGEKADVAGVNVEAIPMYNLTRGPSAGTLFHDKGRGDGYVLTFGDKRIYLSGDTECTDEMRALKNIDVAFVCMNLPYTMPPVEAAECVKAFKPKVLYPYHYRDSKLSELEDALKGQAGIELRERNWY